MAITPTTLEPDTFARKVIEVGLEVRGPYRGYFYAAKAGVKDAELYRTMSTKKWIYQARRVATNVNAAGNPIIIDISVADGQMARLISMEGYQTTTGVHGLLIELLDEDNNIQNQLATTGAAAATKYAFLPSIGTAATASANYAQSLCMWVPPGAKLSVRTDGNSGVANDALTVAMVLELYNVATLPAWDYSRSINAADITLAANTISTTNELQAVLCE